MVERAQVSNRRTLAKELFLSHSVDFILSIILGTRLFASNGRVHRIQRWIQEKQLHLLQHTSLETFDRVKPNDSLRCSQSVQELITEVIPELAHKSFLLTLMGATCIFWFGFSGALTLVPLALGGLLNFLTFPWQLQNQRVVTSDTETLVERMAKAIRTIRSFQAEAFFDRRFEQWSIETDPNRDLRKPLFELFTEFGLMGSIILLGGLNHWVGTTPMAVQGLFILGVYCLLNQFFQVITRSAPLFHITSAWLKETRHPTRPFHPSTPLPTQPQNISLEFHEVTIPVSEYQTVGPFTGKLISGEVWVLSNEYPLYSQVVCDFLSGLRVATAGSLLIHNRKGETFPGKSRIPVDLCSLVEATPFLFNGTIRENLLFHNPLRLTENHVWETLGRLGLAEKIKGFGTLDSNMKQIEANFTHSERYLLGFTRALLLRRPILVLEDPFNSTEKWQHTFLLSLIEEIRQGSLVILSTPEVPDSLPYNGVIYIDKTGQTEFDLFDGLSNATAMLVGNGYSKSTKMSPDRPANSLNHPSV